MKMNNLSVCHSFTFDALDILRERVESSEKVGDFFSQVDQLIESEKMLLQRPVSIELPRKLESKTKNDAQSSIDIFEAVGNLNPADAADPRLWSYLALGPLRQYMLERWKLKDSDWRNAINRRFLIVNPNRRNLTRHGISRLWWVALKTQDPLLQRRRSHDANDMYFYTKWVWESQDRVQNLFENQLGASDPVLWAILETVAERKSSNKKREILKVAKSLNRESGFRHLDLIDPRELSELANLD